MTIDEHNAIITQLRTVDNDADRIGLLTQLSNDYTQTLVQVEIATTERLKAEEQATKFAKLNNELFLQNTNQVELVNQHNNSNVNNVTDNVPPIKKTYEDLENQMFNELRGNK
jgi:hypothetical protein